MFVANNEINDVGKCRWIAGISIAMQMQRYNVECITQWSTSRASFKATGCCHRVSACAILPRRPQWSTNLSKQHQTLTKRNFLLEITVKSINSRLWEFYTLKCTLYSAHRYNKLCKNVRRDTIDEDDDHGSQGGWVRNGIKVDWTYGKYTTIHLTSARCYKRGFKARVGKVKVVKFVTTWLKWCTMGGWRP